MWGKCYRICISFIFHSFGLESGFTLFIIKVLNIVIYQTANVLWNDMYLDFRWLFGIFFFFDLLLLWQSFLHKISFKFKKNEYSTMAWLKTEINQLGQPSRIHNPNNYLHKDAGIIFW